MVSISGTTITSSIAEILLGIIIDSLELNMQKVCRKIKSLGRVVYNYMPLGKHRILLKIFAESQFNICPLIWILHLKNISLIKLIVMQRASRIVYSDYTASFKGLPNKDIFSMYERNVQKFSYRNLKIP